MGLSHTWDDSNKRKNIQVGPKIMEIRNRLAGLVQFQCPYAKLMLSLCWHLLEQVLVFELREDILASLTRLSYLIMNAE